MPIWIPYYGVTLVLLLLSLVVPPLGIYDDNDIEIRYGKKYRSILILIFLILAVFCAFKCVSADSIDEYAYRNRFTRSMTSDLLTLMANSDGEYINTFLTWLSTRLFDNSQGIFILFNGMSVLFYLKAIKKYCIDYTFGIALLMILGIINTMFNITQQSLACAIFACYCDVFKDKKLFKSVLLVVVCFLIHRASIILVLFYFCAKGQNKISKIKVYLPLVSIITGVAYANIDKIVPYFSLLEQYSGIVAQGHAGVQIVTILINCIPGFMILLLKQTIDEEDELTIFSANVCLLHMGLYLASFTDRYIARLAMFSDVFVLIFLSRCDYLFRTQDSYRIFKALCFCLYAIVLFIRMRGITYTFNFVF